MKLKILLRSLQEGCYMTELYQIHQVTSMFTFAVDMDISHYGLIKTFTLPLPVQPVMVTLIKSL